MRHQEGSFPLPYYKKQRLMITAALPNGISYSIPLSDMDFFQKLAERMKWTTVDLTAKKVSSPSSDSWVDRFAAKWQDTRSAEQIVKDIRAARTTNAEIAL